MKKRRTILRWTCTASAAISLTAWIASVRLQAELDFSQGFVLSLHGGEVGLVEFHGTRWTPLPERLADRLRVEDGDWNLQLNVPRVITSIPGLRVWVLPLWTPTALLTACSLLLWRSHLRARRAANENRCPQCTYSLTGLPAGAACPECGKAATAKP